MAVSRVLRRLRSVLELEEEQAYGALERALGALAQLEAARAAAIEREHRGRRLLISGAVQGEIVDRLAGMEEGRTARRVAETLKTRIAEAAKDAVARREAFLAKRVERRQVGTLIEEAQAAEAAETTRREQQSTDKWFLDKKRRAAAAAEAPQPSSGVERKAEVRKT